MHNAFSAIVGLIVPVFLVTTIANVAAAPPAQTAKDRYIATRDAAIEKISAIYDADNPNDAARKAEEVASADLAAQMRAILNEPARDGFGPIRDNYRKAEQAEDDLRSEKIDRRTYDRLGNLRQKSEDEYRRGFTQNTPKQLSFAEATRQAQKLLSTALNAR